MYVSSMSPIPANSTQPPTARLLRSNARASRTARVMARGRLSNQQQQLDHPQAGCDLTSTDLIGGTVPSSSSFSAAPAAVSSVPGPAASAAAPLTPTMPQTIGAVSSAGSTLVNSPKVVGVSHRLPTGGQRTASERQYIAEAPVMVVGEVAKLMCAPAAEDQPVETHPRSAPPWGNAIVLQRRAAPASLGGWFQQNPWAALVLAAVGGLVLLEGSNR